MSAEPTYRYLDLRPAAGAWPGATATATVYDPDDCVRLAPVAADATALSSSPSLAGAASVAVAADGSVYLADPDRPQLLELHCDGTIDRYGCLGPPVLVSPRGVVVGPRDRLYVADAGDDEHAGRIVVVDRGSGTLVDVWTELGTPADLAVDAAGRLYIVDTTGGRILRTDADGAVDPAFDPPVDEPRAIAVASSAAGERLIVVCAGGPLVVVHVGDRDDTGADATIDETFDVGIADPANVTAAGDTFYVATPGGVLAFAADGALVGLVSGASSAAVAVDCRGRLVVAGSRGVHRWDGVGRAREGRLLLGPLPLVDGIERWERIVVERADDAARAGELHVRLWTRTSAATAAPPLPPDTSPLTEDPARTPTDRWRACPPDAPDALVLHVPAPYLWICVDLSGDGSESPAVRSLRVDHLGAGLPGKLPALFAAADRDETTYRLVQLLAAPIDATAATIDDLPRGFDAAAAPLDRLAQVSGWLGHTDDRRRSEAQRRQAVSQAFARHGRRGTTAELEQLLAEFVGAPVRLSEPAREVALWALGEVRLGEQTMLVPAPAQGAVVGTTAEVDRSHLITDTDIGWPLNADVAHRFRVHVAAPSLPDDVERELWALIEREKPAHTLATLCVAAPGVRVGTGCIGPDLVVGGSCPTGHRPAAAHRAADPPPAVGEAIGLIHSGGTP